MLTKTFKTVLCAAGIAALATVSRPLAQEKEDRTLLTTEQMMAIINEASGERAMHHVQELVPYQRVRPASEYQTHFRESEVMARFAKEYGFSNIAIDSYGQTNPAGQPSTAWQPVQGELWTVTPRRVKLYDIHDIVLSLASLNANGDVTGELVDVGQGRAQDFEGKDVTGKFVLASGGLGGAYAQAVSRGGLGAIAVSAIGLGPRTTDYPEQIVSTTVTATKDGTAAWAVSPKVARDLASWLARGQKVTIQSIVKSVQVASHAEYVHAEIPGDGSTTQEIAIGGHLYEGVIKQGANDDNSGCALTLEVGRAYLKLVQEGKLPRPRRTINFQWVPEISGTNAWLNAHPDKNRNIIGDLNFDMEGIRLAASRSYWIMQRTPDTFPSYLNDIGQSMMEYVSDLTRERVRYRANGYAPSVDVTSPNGSTDAFYIKIDKHYGASDHVTYMQHGIPAVMFITWPDMWYHSSGDTPDKQDATQYKRAASVAIGAMAVMAASDDVMGARVAVENLGRGTERMGDSERKGVAYLADAANALSLAQAYKEARTAVLHQAGVEKAVVKSAAVLFAHPADAQKTLAPFDALIDKRAAALTDEVTAVYGIRAVQVKVAPAEPVMTAEEKEASSLIVECVNGSSFSGCNQAPGAGGRGAGAGGGRGQGGGRGFGGPSVPQHMSAELNILVGQKKTALEIRDFLSGEFEPVALADVMAVLRAREQAGVIKLTRK